MYSESFLVHFVAKCGPLAKSQDVEGTYHRPESTRPHPGVSILGVFAHDLLGPHVPGTRQAAHDVQCPGADQVAAVGEMLQWEEYLSTNTGF